MTYVPAHSMVQYTHRRSAVAPHAQQQLAVQVSWEHSAHNSNIIVKLFCTNWYKHSRTRCQPCVGSDPSHLRPAVCPCDRARRLVSRPSRLAGVPSATLLFFTVHKIAARCHSASCRVVEELMPLPRAFATHYFGSLSIAKKTKSQARGPMR